MKKIVYAVYSVSPNVFRQLIRNIISIVRLLSGQSNIEYEHYNKGAANSGVPVHDNNLVIEDPLTCQICEADDVISPYADFVRVESAAAVRKTFHMCRNCGFLFTCENRNDREDFFEKTPYIEDQEGLRTGREVDLVELLQGIQGIDLRSNILIYAVGKGNTLDLLREKGYLNVWGADVSNGVNYGGRLINIANESDYFSCNNIRFDIIISVEVWEHYSQDEIGAAFSWQFEQLSDKGILVGTTSLWASGVGNEYFRGKFESGVKFLKLWHYPFFVDHTSLYTEEAMRLVANKFDMTVCFAYFDNPYVHIMDPGKRIIFMTKKSNTERSEYIEKNYSREFLPVHH